MAYNFINEDQDDRLTFCDAAQAPADDPSKINVRFHGVVTNAPPITPVTKAHVEAGIQWLDGCAAGLVMDTPAPTPVTVPAG